MSRRVCLLGVGVALVALALTNWALGPQTGMTGPNARRVKAGLTVGEVEAIFGGPPPG